MYQATRLNETAQLLRPLFALPAVLAQLAWEAMTTGSDPTVSPETARGVERVRVAMRDGLIDAAPGTMRQAVQMGAAASGEPIPSFEHALVPDILTIPRGVAPRAPAVAVMPSAAQATAADPWDSPEWDDPIPYTLAKAKAPRTAQKKGARKPRTKAKPAPRRKAPAPKTRAVPGGNDAA